MSSSTGPRNITSDPHPCSLWKKGLLDGVPKALPALLQADEIVERVGRVQFQPLAQMASPDRIRDQIDRFTSEAEKAPEAVLGELLLALASLAHEKGLDPESALRGTLTRFREQFGAMEGQALAGGQPLVDLSSDEINALWQSLGRRKDMV